MIGIIYLAAIYFLYQAGYCPVSLNLSEAVARLLASNSQGENYAAICWKVSYGNKCYT